MEYVTESNLQKYETIIDAINKSNEELILLKKKHEEVNRHLFALRLCQVRDILKTRLIKAIIKVFNSIFELYNLYKDDIRDEELKKLAASKDGVYCLIQIHIFNEFYYKLKCPGWFLHIKLENGIKNVIKTIPIMKTANPIFIVIPFIPSYVYDKVSINLVWKVSDLTKRIYWPKLNICSVPINISYHFKSPLISRTSLNENCMISQLNMLYGKKSKNFNEVHYKFSCKYTCETFLNIILKNCYHQVDIRNNFAIIRNGDELTVKLMIDSVKEIRIKLDEKARVLSIFTTPFLMYLLKQYIADEGIMVDVSSIDFDKIWNKLVVSTEK